MAKPEQAYGSYKGFLQVAIKSYWDGGPKKVNFLALLLATKETWSVAISGAANPETGKKVLTGVAGAGAIAILLRLLVGGPIGILLTAGSIASLVALYVKNHKRIWAKVGHYKDLIQTYRPKYDGVVAQYKNQSVDEEQLELMVDGLMARFLNDIDAFEPEPSEEYEEDDDRSAFERHVDDKRDAEDEVTAE